MTLRGGKRRSNDVRPGWLRLLAASALVVVLAAASASAQEALVLFKTPAKDGGVDLIVRGARPGEIVRLLLDGSPDSGPAPYLYNAYPADGGGIVRFHFSDIPAGGDLFAQALTSDLRSNVIPLREMPALYLLVDEAESGARVLRFDPTRGTLEPLLGRLDADSAVSFVRYLPVAARDGSLVRSGTDSSALGGATLNSGERPIDLVASVDQSMLMALTREDLPQGRAVIRLRLIETNPDTHEIATVEIQRGGGRLVSAWLVSDVESRRTLIAERDGTLREVVLGAEPGRGVTIVPLAPQSGEELLNVKIHDNQVVVVTKPGPLSSRRTTTSRMLVFDLNERGDPVETLLNSAALGFEVAERPDGPAAFIVLDSGQIEVVPLDPAGEHAPPLALPDVRQIARGPDGNLFALQQGSEASVSRIDAATLAVDPVLALGRSSGATRFGVFGGRVDRVLRTWLYVVEPQAGPGATDDELLYAELDPVDGRAAGVVPLPLGGHVRRIANR
jgi:hypothetical protein